MSSLKGKGSHLLPKRMVFHILYKSLMSFYILYKRLRNSAAFHQSQPTPATLCFILAGLQGTKKTLKTNLTSIYCLFVLAAD